MQRAASHAGASHAGTGARVGVAGAVLLGALGLGSLAAAHAGAAPAGGCATLGVGAHGAAVAVVQRAVKATPDGDFGPQTRAALSRWQHRHRLPRTGTVDAATWAALPREVALAACSASVSGSGVRPACPTLRRGAAGTVVAVLQKAVGATPDGAFGPRTKAALATAQRRLKLPAAGVAGTATWAALGLTGTPACTAAATDTAACGGSSSAGGTVATGSPSPSPSGTPTAATPTPTAQPKPPADAKQQAVIAAQVAKLAAGLPQTPGTSNDPLALEALHFARSQHGKPYQWGGVGPKAYDCSGLVMTAYRHAGITTPRVAADQYGTGTAVPLDQVQQGDLLFYAGDLTKPATIYHVVMYAGAGTIVDAPYTGAVVGTRPLWTAHLLPVAWRPSGLLTLPIQPGALGAAVSQLQRALVRGGAAISVDGAFGPQTTAAVKSWQTAHHLPPTGVVDLTTWLTLN